MVIRSYEPGDSGAIADLSAACARGEGDFVLNPLWENEDELHAEFARFGIDPAEHVLVACDDDELIGFAGFLRHPGADTAGLLCPVVKPGRRSRGVGGELLRAVHERASRTLGIRFATAGIGTRNRAGYSLLASHGYRPLRQHFFMRCDATPHPRRAPLAERSIAMAEPSDAGAILEIYEKCGFQHRDEEEMICAMQDGRHVHAIARESDRVVAFVELETHLRRRIWVAFVGVVPERRDRGIGSSLVAWALAREFEAGARSAMLLLSPANRTAVRAYEKVGFRRARLIDVLGRDL